MFTKKKVIIEFNQDRKGDSMHEFSGLRNVEYYYSGMIKSYESPMEDQYAVGDQVVKTAAGAKIRFHESGSIQSLVLGEDRTFTGANGEELCCLQGEQIWVRENGEVYKDPFEISQSQLKIPVAENEQKRKKMNRLAIPYFYNDAADVLNGEAVFYSNPQIPNLESEAVNFMSQLKSSSRGAKVIIFDRGISFISYLTQISSTEAYVEDVLPGRLLGRNFDFVILDPNGNSKNNILLSGRLDTSEKLHYRVIFQGADKATRSKLERLLRSPSVYFSQAG